MLVQNKLNRSEVLVMSIYLIFFPRLIWNKAGAVVWHMSQLGSYSWSASFCHGLSFCMLAVYLIESCLALVGHLCIMDLSFGSRWWYQHHRITPRWYLVMSTLHALPAEGSKRAHCRAAGVVDVLIAAPWLQRWRSNLCWLVWWWQTCRWGCVFSLHGSRRFASLGHWMWWLYKTSSTDLRFRWCQFT